MDGVCAPKVTPTVDLLGDCYQCGKCTAGCPMANCMDLMPNQVFRLVQLGELDKAIRCDAIWQCVSCFTCATRCPQSVDCVGVMDKLRQLAVEKGVASKNQLRVILFQQAFLDNIRRYGRLYEVHLIASFKVAGFLKDRDIGQLMAGAGLGPKLKQKGKLHLTAGHVRDRGVVGRIFARCASSTVANESPSHD